MPTKLVFGDGCIEELPAFLESLGSSSQVIITDNDLLGSNQIEQVQHLCEDSVTVITAPVGEPTVETVEETARQLAGASYDTVIGIGGGSVLDTAKLARLTARHQGADISLATALESLMSRPPSKLILIPTTAGTGSEVGPFAVVGKASQVEKIAVGGDGITADLAIVDPQMTWSLPPGPTAATGFDALTHAIEAYCSRAASPITDDLSLRSMALCSKHLSTVTRSPEPIGRAALMEAATLAGISFSNAGLGLCHAISGPLGALTHIAHGVANGLVLRAALEYNRPSLGERYQVISSVMGADPLVTLSKITEELSFPRSLSEVGISKSDIKNLADLAMNSKQILNNPRAVTATDIERILEQLL